jgi:FAD/FMN-containing dehydrogenase
MVGSEGTLGVVTKIVLKLPKKIHNVLMLVPFTMQTKLVKLFNFRAIYS